MPTAAEIRQAEIDQHPSNKDTIDYTNEYAWRATNILRHPEARASVLDPNDDDAETDSRNHSDRVALAQAQATLALAEETRTAALVAYLATLGKRDKQRSAVERDVQIRLGLINPKPARTRSVAPAEQVKRASVNGTSS